MGIQQNLFTSDAATKRLRWLSIVETISFVVLVWMMVTANEQGVSIVGAIHGFLFLVYAIFVIRDREQLGWGWAFVAVAVLTGPIGPILVLENLRRK
ncbi:MAG: DUF3817 domain-containing protein [Actinobacteria bacterium]|nr:DUF3817 domain-containing protein [Actinomycetota bacterium]